MAKMQLNMTYALKDSVITSISNVESGLKCGCVCPACGEPIIAKKGTKMMHHFAHHAGHNCEYGYESSLHLAAKDILSKAKKLQYRQCMSAFRILIKKKNWFVREEK